MHRWQVGSAEIVRVESASFALPTDHVVAPWVVPAFAPTEHEIGAAFSAIAIAVDGHRIVVDPWLADDHPRERPDAGDEVDRLLAELAEAGFSADEVDIVVNSHVDGTGWNSRPGPDGWVPTFPNARYLFPTAELESIDRGDEVYGGEDHQWLERAGVVERIDGNLDLTPSVSLVDAPGHNAGHWAVRIETGDDLAVIPGHLILSVFQVADPEEDLGEIDLAVASRTRRAMLEELADRQGLLVTTLLGGVGGGRVERQGDGFALRA